MFHVVAALGISGSLFVSWWWSILEKTVFVIIEGKKTQNITFGLHHSSDTQENLNVCGINLYFG